MATFSLSTQCRNWTFFKRLLIYDVHTGYRNKLQLFQNPDLKVINRSQFATGCRCHKELWFIEGFLVCKVSTACCRGKTKGACKDFGSFSSQRAVSCGFLKNTWMQLFSSALHMGYHCLFQWLEECHCLLLGKLSKNLQANVLTEWAIWTFLSLKSFAWHAKVRGCVRRDTESYLKFLWKSERR